MWNYITKCSSILTELLKILQYAENMTKNDLFKRIG